MKALQIVAPQKIEIVDVPKPTIGERDVLIKVKAVGICGTDLELLRGEMPYITHGFTRFPIIPGHEWSGIVEDTGKLVTNFKPGDRVTGDVSIGCGNCCYCRIGRYNLCVDRYEVGVFRNKDGAYAEYISMPERHIYKIPDNVSMEEAALTEPAATAAYAVIKTGVGFGNTVLSIGDGPIGQLAVQCAKAAGASKVIVVGSWDEKLKIAVDNGADYALNYKRDDIVGMSRVYTDGEGVDVVIENSGNTLAFARSIEAVRYGGKIVLVSIYGKGAFPIDIDSMILKDVDMYGILASPNSFKPTLAMMGKGAINVKPLISHKYPLDKINEAIEMIKSRRECRMKVLLMP